MNSYFLQINGAQAGPYTTEELQRMLSNRSVKMETLYWQEGMEEWAPIDRDADLLFTSPPIAPPRPSAPARPSVLTTVLISLVAVLVVSAGFGGLWYWMLNSPQAIQFPPLGILLLLLPLYFLPAFIAARSPWVGWIAVLNLLFGWTIVVWIVCIIAAISAPKSA